MARHDTKLRVPIKVCADLQSQETRVKVTIASNSRERLSHVQLAGDLQQIVEVLRIQRARDYLTFPC